MAEGIEQLEAMKALLDFKLQGGEVDESSGAPPGTRKAVGSAQTPRDRLSTIRKKFPDARPYSDDNFIYTSPTTGRPTLYNPPGFDTGDLYSISPEGFELAGGAAAARAVAPAALNPATLAGSRGTSLLTIPLAFGLGGAGFKEVDSLLSQYVGSTDDTRTTPQKLTDAGVTAGTGAIFERLGIMGGDLLKRKMIDPAARALTRFTNPSGPKRMEAFQQAGVQPRAASATGNAGIEQAEQLLGLTPGGANIVREGAERETAQVGQAVDDLASDYAGGRPLKSEEEVGFGIRRGVQTALNKFTNRKNELYEKAFNIIPRETPVRLDDVAELTAKFDELADASQVESLAGTNNPALEMVQNILRDVEMGRMSFQDFRKVRTNIGKDLENAVIVGATTKSQDGQMRQLYGTLSEIMKRKAASSGAGKQLALADRYTRMNSKALQRLEFLNKNNLDSSIINVFEKNLKNGPEIIRGTRQTLELAGEKEAFDDLAGLVLGKLGVGRPGTRMATDLMQEGGEEFSARTFLTRWNQYNPAAKRAMFGGTRYAKLVPRLDNLTKVSGFVRDADKLANRSNTAQYVLIGLGLTGGGVYGGASAFDTGEFDVGDTVAGAAKTAGSLYLGPKLAAKMITSPTFVRWLSQMPSPKAQESAVVQWISRLTGVAKAEPAIKEEVLKLQEGARAVQ